MSATAHREPVTYAAHTKSKRMAAFALALAASAVLVIALALGLTEAGRTRGVSEVKISQNSVSGRTGKIVFSSYPKGSDDPEIFVMSADGSGRSSLADHPSGNDPDWSPDGKKIAFTSPDFEIYVMNADGSGQTDLTNDPVAVDEEPDWSPDGAKILFASDGEVSVMNADGSGRTNLTKSAFLHDGPTWSPDGRKIAFTSGDVFVMNADGTDQTNLTNGSEHYSPRPAWSPDGKKLVYSHGETHDIFVMNADGSNQVPLAQHRRGNGPIWSPDGTRIAFTSLGVNEDIFVANADGSGRANLTKSAAGEISPDWNAHPLPRCVVPRVVGRSLEAASTRIRAASCTVGRVRYFRPASRRGRVLEQSLRPGTRSPHGTQVNLVVRRTLVTAPALSKDTLSFVRGHSIFLARSDGSRISMVLHGTENKFYFDPAWSPNGDRLAVTVGSLPFGTHEYDDVKVFRGSRRLSSVDSGGSRPGNAAWAPDGRHIVLVGYEFDDGGALYTTLPGTGSRAVEKNHDEDIADNQPSWSPAGTAIAFSRVAPSVSGLYLIRPNGRQLRRLTTTPAYNPSWSPDGRRVVFDDGRAINVISADGSGLRQLVTNGDDPAWSPDGRTIAFVRKESIWVMDPTGAHVREVIRNADQPTWKSQS